ncbi:hypothetical protein [Bifidobacterium crudilactis]|jgi:hypothetical protein|uniref:hypothetical protein n=1 Tax=Bifidobacterium crudilactis TaxID=327277 RepID=UPI002356A8AE|nr:hypothetical protein [Bifidobacterium crudilactis]MCI1217958.1 hypothetical protein [Bifidobacterium crudilactis]MCI1637746.1 hypothetical protein [Bifidobacterium crudilactis]
MQAERSYDDEEAHNRLRLSDFDIPESLVAQALHLGRAAFVEYTADDQAGAQGYAILTKVVRTLTEATQSGELSGYTRLSGNQARFFNEKKGMQFITSSSDNRTGLREGSVPSTLYDKGPQTRQKVEANRAILGIVDDSALFPETLDEVMLPPAEKVLTWILLYHVLPDGTVRSEFSLPTACEERSGNKCRISDWKYRIILPEIPPETDISGMIAPPDPTMYDFTVKRKEE